MKKNAFFSTFIFIIALLFVTALSASSVQAQSQKTNPAVGVWKLVYPEVGTMGNQTKKKIITEGHFIWVHTFDNVVAYSLGGICSYDGETYTETVQYRSPNMEDYIGEKAVYKLEFKDGKMYCSGTFGPEKIYEIWERVE